ncbi:MAG TPA: glycoside hydrolase family 16 protein [Pyrinomonadaceae bacterium]|nr:glycoside hydrolase family 16 protein [Pyrinomonadaceae bacterium]
MCRKSLKTLFIIIFITAFFAQLSAQGQVRYRKLTFKDEFNGASGSGVDTSKWTAEIGGGGWGNQELQYYTNSTDNAYLDGNGNLVIKAIKLNPPLTLSCWYGPCQYTSARLITKGKFEQKYGKFEARIKIPRSQGMWSAFWMLGNNIDTVGWATCGEIDIMENIGREPVTVHGTIHGPGYSGANGLSSNYNLSNNAPFADDFHVYSTEWSENKIQFFVDGNLYKTLTPTDLPNGSKWVYDHPFFIILNFAVGGPWGGNPDNTSVFPNTMVVDYVRVYKR